MKEYLKKLAEQNGCLYYCPNPGNAGDSLIAFSTFQLFDKLGISYRIINKEDFDSYGKIVIYPGGGNLTEVSSGDARNFIMKIHRQAKKLVILPHTISGNQDLLRSLGENTDIFCREEVSFEHVKKYASKANVLLSDDMALYLDAGHLLQNKPKKTVSLMIKKAHAVLFDRKSRRNFPSWKAILRPIKHRIRKITFRDNKNLNAFRIDSEKTEFQIPRDNIDVSWIFGFGTQNKELVELSSFQFLNFLSRYESIHTNRLHCAIGAALLNKKVYLYANNYYKNKAVWEYSLKKRFPNMQWVCR